MSKAPKVCWAFRAKNCNILYHNLFDAVALFILMKRLVLMFMILSAACVPVVVAQKVEYLLPSFQERFGKGIRKVVMIQEYPEQPKKYQKLKQTFKISRDGNVSSNKWPKAKANPYVDSIVSHRDFETLADSTFEIRNGNTELIEVKWYSDSTFTELVKLLRCRKGVRRSTSIRSSVGDTIVWLFIDDTNKYAPKPYFSIRKEYNGGKTRMDYDPDSLLISSSRLVRDSRGLVDTIVRWRRYGPPYGGVRSREAEQKEWLQTETHQYKYNRRGGVVEERIFIDGELKERIRYRLRYRHF